jgi:hypothetical protein
MWTRVDAPPAPKVEVEPEPDSVPLENMSKDALLAQAEQLGLEVTRRTSKLKLVSLLREASQE